MLKYDRNERISAAAALSHVYLLVKSGGKMPTTVLSDTTWHLFAEYINSSRLVKLLSFLYASRWKECHCSLLRETLHIFDLDQDGVISKTEFFESRVCSPSHVLVQRLLPQ